MPLGSGLEPTSHARRGAAGRVEKREDEVGKRMLQCMVEGLRLRIPMSRVIAVGANREARAEPLAWPLGRRLHSSVGTRP